MCTVREPDHLSPKFSSCCPTVHAWPLAPEIPHHTHQDLQWRKRLWPAHLKTNFWATNYSNQTYWHKQCRDGTSMSKNTNILLFMRWKNKTNRSFQYLKESNLIKMSILLWKVYTTHSTHDNCNGQQIVQDIFDVINHLAMLTAFPNLSSTHLKVLFVCHNSCFTLCNNFK